MEPPETMDVQHVGIAGEQLGEEAGREAEAAAIAPPRAENRCRAEGGARLLEAGGDDGMHFHPPAAIGHDGIMQQPHRLRHPAPGPRDGRNEEGELGASGR